MELRAAFGLILCFSTQISGKLMVTVNGSDVSHLQSGEHVTIFEGDYLQFGCKSNYSGAKYDWIIGDNGYVVSNDTLELKAAQVHDQNFYYCRATLYDNVTATDIVESKYIEVEVLTPPSSPVVKNPSNCIFGEEIEMTCVSVGNPTPNIHWTENDENGSILSRDPTYRTTCAPADHLDLACIALSRIYTTYGEPRNIMKYVKIRQYVQTKSSVSIAYGTLQSFKKGENVSVTCNTNGYPESHIWWTKADNPTFRLEGRYLKIYAIQGADCGVYICNADRTILSVNGRSFDTYDSAKVQIFVLENGTVPTEGHCRPNTASVKMSENNAVTYTALFLAILALLLSLASTIYLVISRKKLLCLQKIRKKEPSGNMNTAMSSVGQISDDGYMDLQT